MILWSTIRVNCFTQSKTTPLGQDVLANYGIYVI